MNNIRKIWSVITWLCVIWLTSSMALFWNFPLFCNFPLMICNFPLFSFFNIRIADRTWNWQLSNVLIYALILSLRVCVYFDFKKWRVDFSCCPTKIYKNFQTVLIIKTLHLSAPCVLITMWLTRNHMFRFVKFWINYPRSFFEIYPKFPSQTCDY